MIARHKPFVLYLCCETRRMYLTLKFHFQNDSRQPEILQHTNKLFHPQLGSEEILRASRRCYSILRAKSVQVRKNSAVLSIDGNWRLVWNISDNRNATIYMLSKIDVNNLKNKRVLKSQFQSSNRRQDHKRWSFWISEEVQSRKVLCKWI